VTIIAHLVIIVHKSKRGSLLAVRLRCDEETANFQTKLILDIIRKKENIIRPVGLVVGATVPSAASNVRPDWRAK